MSTATNKTASDWQKCRLGDLGKLIGGGTPSRAVARYYSGTIPWVTIKDLKDGVFEIHDSKEHITAEAIENSATNLIEPESVIIATRVGLGKVAVNAAPVTINQDLKGFRPNRNALPRFIAFLIHKLTFDILKYSQGTTVKGIRQEDLLNLEIALPPLLVQEQIVEILQRADEIRRKRQDAADTNSAILPAIFIELFGDPLTNPKGYPLVPLGKVIKEGPQNGLYKPQEAYGEGTRIVRTKNYYGGALNDQTTLWRLDCTPEEVETYRLMKGDILVNRVNSVEYVGKCALIPDLSENTVYESNTMRFRVNENTALPEYVTAFLCTESSRRQIMAIGARKRAVNMVSINQQDVKALRLPLAPLELQRKFVKAVSQHGIAASHLGLAYEDASDLLEGLLNRAFTGELTAEWENANADLISEWQAFSERLPKLVLLAFLKEKSTRVENSTDASVLITAMMKYVFLLQMEATSRRRFYDFVPYQYGPFARDLYTDLEALREQGLITMNNGDETRTRISITPGGEAKLSELPDDVGEDVTAIFDSYGHLSHSKLLARVYERFPIYTTKAD